MTLEEFLKYKIAEIGSFQLSVYNLVEMAATILIMWIVLIIAKRIIYRFDKFDEGKKYALYRLLKYIILVIAVVVILKIFGVDVTVFIAGSAALLVGLGLGIQSMFNDFISGIEILLDGTVKVNDIIEVDGTVAKVKEIGLRSSFVVTNDGVSIIVPNSVLTSKNLVNWTHTDIKSRFHLQVGIAYSSDADKAMQIMIDSASAHKLVDKEPAPYVRLKDFGDSAVMLDLLFWSKEIFIIDDVKSDIRKDIYKKFGENNIEIPFPQRTLHFNADELSKIKDKS
jgi:small-conductance mechanosensitive channel